MAMEFLMILTTAPIVSTLNKQMRTKTEWGMCVIAVPMICRMILIVMGYVGMWITVLIAVTYSNWMQMKIVSGMYVTLILGVGSADTRSVSRSVKFGLLD